MRLLVAVAVQLAEGKRLQHGEMDTVSRDTYRTLEMTLDPGDYSLLGFGDDRITDLDLVVRDEKGNVVARDTAVDNAPMVTFPVRRRGVYRIELKAPGWAWGHSEGFFAVSIAVQ
jgi:hypothetical protein